MDEETKNESEELGDVTPDTENGAKYGVDIGEKSASEKNPAQAERNTDIIKESVNHARLLLNFAAERGKEIDAETQKIVVDFSHKVDKQNKWNSTEESNFLSGLCEISRSLYPVTFDTLRSSRGLGARFFVSAFSGITIIVLLTLVYFQFLWVVLGNVTQTIEVQVKELKDSEIELNDLEFQNHGLKIEFDKLQNELRDDTPADDKTIDRISSLRDRIRTNNTKTFELEINLREIEDQLKASARILVKWLPLQGWLITSRPPDPGFWESDEITEKKRNAIREWEDTRKEELSFRNKALHTWSKQILQGLSSYILPMIYGVLGACAFVLRLMSKQIRNLTFSRSTASIQYILRVILGALAGISIGWFLKPDPSGTNMISAISPLALAFVAGYSVELVFTAMDKIISAFIGQISDQTKGEKAKEPN